MFDIISLVFLFNYNVVRIYKVMVEVWYNKMFFSKVLGFKIVKGCNERI